MRVERVPLRPIQRGKGSSRLSTMCCCNGEEEYEDKCKDHVDLSGGPYPPVIKKRRWCTDVFCCIIFIVFLAGMAIFGIIGFTQGDPRKLILPKDSEGRICGLDSQRGKEHLVFFDFTRCVRVDSADFSRGCSTTQVCVEACPTENTYYLQLELLSQTDRTAARNKLVCKSGVNVTIDQRNIISLVQTGACASYTLDSTSVLNRCVPKVSDSTVNTLLTHSSNKLVPIVSSDSSQISTALLQKAQEGLAKMESLQEVGDKALQDLYKSWKFILAVYAGALVVCVLWIILMRFLMKAMIIFGFVAVIAVLGFGAYVCFAQYTSIKNGVTSSEVYKSLTTYLSSYIQSQNLWLALGIITAIIAVILLLIFFFLIRNLCIALALLAEGSRAISHVMTTLIWPVIPFCLQVAIFVYWVAATLYIASAGHPLYEIKNGPNTAACPYTTGQPCNPKEFNYIAECSKLGTYCAFKTFGFGSQYPISSYIPNYKPELEGLLSLLNEYQWIPHIYNLFGMFWLMFFIEALNQCVLAGVFASYYWAYDKPDDIPKLPLLKSLGRAVGFHMGSLALGSLLITMLRIIRILLEFLDHRLKGKDNCCARFLLTCLKCCFWCLETCLRFLNKNAYIMMSIYGTGYCTSARNAAAVLLKNIGKTIVINRVTSFLLFINKAMVVASVGVASWYFFAGKIPIHELQELNPQLNFPIVPVVLIIVGSYIIATCFFSVYEMAVDTLYLCLLEDIQINDGSIEKPYFMSQDLRIIMFKTNKVGAEAMPSADHEKK